MIKKITLMIWVCFAVSVAKSQQKSLRIIEVNDQTPMMGAHVCLVDQNGVKKYYVADIDGKVHIPASDGTTCVVSYAGYKTQTVVLDNKTSSIKMQPDLLMLDQVVLTATVEAEKVDQSIYKIGVLNARTLEKQGAQNARDALRFQPNINLREDGVLGSQVIMQGLKGQHVKLLIDGIPVIGRQDGNIDLSQIDMTQVEHIEIIEGPMSVVYGSNALAGTINIITKDEKYRALNGSAQLYAESVGQINGSINISGTKGKHKYGLNTGYRFFNGLDLDKNDRWMNWSPKNQLNIDGFYGFKSNGWDSKLGIRFNRELLNIKGDLVSATNAFDNRFNTTRATYYGMVSKRFSERSVTTGMLSYSTFDRSSQSYFLNLATGSENKSGDESKDRFTAWNNRISHALTFNENWKWQIGYEGNHETGAGAKISENEGLTENAIWSDVQIQVSDAVTFQPGIRVLHHNVYEAPMIYSAHLKWQKRNWNGRLSFARGFRAPGMKELYMDFVDFNHQIFGNDQLTSETSYNINGSLGRTLELTEKSVVKLAVSSYYNHLSDVIELIQGNDGVAYYYQNIAEKKTHGGGAELNINHNNRIQTTIGWMLTGIGYDPLENGTFNYRYFNDLTSNISYFFPVLDLSARMDYKYTDERVQLYAASTEDEIVEGTVGAYHMLNYSMTKGFANKKYLLTIGAKNLLDVTNISNTTRGGAHSGSSDLMIAWGRSYFVSFKFNLKKI